MSNAPIQQPVSYAVGDTPIRIGGLIAPYTLINSEILGTIWLADNAGVKPGFGTPLHPGTSLVWNRPGDFFAVCSPGESCGLIISDVTDWEPDPAAIAAAVLNAGILIIDNPETIMQATVNGPGLTTPIDISRFQSLNISIALNLDNPVTPIDNRLQLLFGDGGTTTYILHFVYSNEDMVWTASVPCYGDSFRLNILTDSTYDCFVSGSFRQQSNVRQRIDEYSSAGVLVSAGTSMFFDVFAAGGRAVGTTVLCRTPPWYGQIHMQIRWTSPAVAAVSFDALVANQINPGTFNAFQQVNGAIVQGVAPAAHTYQLAANILTNGETLEFSTVNSYAAVGTNFSARVTPLTGQLNQ